MNATPRAARTALLVIDLQVGVVRTCVDVDGVLARTTTLVERARAEGVPVVWVQDEQDFPPGSDDWQLAAPLEPAPGEARISKGYRDCFAGTGLTGILTRYGATRLVIAGAQSDFCVRTAAQSAAAAGYDVTLVGDCHTTSGGELAGVVVGGEQLVAHTNQYFAGLRYPGQTFAVVPHDEVTLAPAAVGAAQAGA